MKWNYLVEADMLPHYLYPAHKFTPEEIDYLLMFLLKTDMTDEVIISVGDFVELATGRSTAERQREVAKEVVDTLRSAIAKSNASKSCFKVECEFPEKVSLRAKLKATVTILKAEDDVRYVGVSTEALKTIREKVPAQYGTRRLTIWVYLYLLGSLGPKVDEITGRVAYGYNLGTENLPSEVGAISMRSSINCVNRLKEYGLISTLPGCTGIATIYVVGNDPEDIELVRRAVVASCRKRHYAQDNSGRRKGLRCC